MSDDYVYLWIVVIVYLIFILYLNYMQNMAIIKRDWADLKCNPIFMLTKSISAPAAESSEDFQTCIRKYSGNSITNKPVAQTNDCNDKNILGF